MKKIPTIIGTLAFLALACGIEPPPPPPPQAPNLETPNGVLQIIVYAFNDHKDAEAIYKYKTALSPDFVFNFNPADVGDIVNGYQIPESWNYSEDWTATRNMFNEAYDIKLGTLQVGEPSANDAEFFAGNVTISLTVKTTELNGYRCDKGYCDFQFKKQTDGTWRLVKWWDHTTSNRGGAEPSSLGRIKAYFK